LTNVSRGHNIVCPSLEESETLFKKFHTIVELVVCKLREVTRRHDGEAVRRYVGVDFRVREEKDTAAGMRERELSKN
jgi:hypothetical protein